MLCQNIVITLIPSYSIIGHVSGGGVVCSINGPDSMIDWSEACLSLLLILGAQFVMFGDNGLYSNSIDAVSVIWEVIS